MLINIRSSYQKFNARTLRRELYSRIKAELDTIKGFHQKEFYLSENSRCGIAIDRAGQKLVLIKLIEDKVFTSVLHCSDLISVHHYHEGSAINSVSNRLISESGINHRKDPLSNSDPTYLKLYTIHKEHSVFIVSFARPDKSGMRSKLRVQNNPGYWFNRCKDVIQKAEEKSESMASRNCFLR